MLRRLKYNYIRSTLKAERLNYGSILHAHKVVAPNIELDPQLDDWISRASVRTSIFSMNYN